MIITQILQVEMEFVQSLANPNYLHFLAQRGFMKDPCFVNYLSHLMYWKVGLYQFEMYFPTPIPGACLRVFPQVPSVPPLLGVVAARDL